jgi:Holliday junction resolvase RusA-like endonuclease
MNERSVGFVIFGVCYSMKNSKIPRRNAPGMLKHPKARQFERDFMLQVLPHHRKELGSRKRPLRGTVRVFYPSRRQDLDAELVFDLLQKAHVVLNDRYFREKHLFGEVDAKNPRVEILVEEI